MKLAVIRPLLALCVSTARRRPFVQGGVLLAARLFTDCAVVAVANVGAFALKFELAIPFPALSLMIYGLPIAVCCYGSAFVMLSVHRSIWRFVGVEELRRLILAAVLGAAFHTGTLFVLGWRGYPRSVLLATPIFLIVLSGGLRLARRLSTVGIGGHQGSMDGEHQRIVIVGAGNTGQSIAREVRPPAASGCQVVGFVDDAPTLAGQTIHGLPVLGRTDELSDIVQRYRITEAVIAIPRLRVNDLRRIAASCSRAGIRFRCLPSVSQLVRGDGKLRYLRKIAPDELLMRESGAVEEASARAFLQGACVLVTGAGGSIGSELCRQVLRLGAKSAVMVERAENALYEIAVEIERRHGPGAGIPVLADVRHVARMTEVFERYRPRIVFHAAAYKHVPMLEDHPIEAVLNNVVGTRRLAELTTRYAVGTFVFVSTDKAANPTNIMGATKKIGEMYVRSLSSTTSACQSTRSVVVRFGNVLGSAGSVVPLFERQVENGDSITITHPDVSRFLMTVSEAVGLLLQSAAMARGGEIFVLDMGEPRKISDLAEDVVLALGLSPSEVGRTFIGLRPGEKLHETLWADGESVGQSQHQRVFVVNGGSPAANHIEALVTTLENLARAGKVAELLRTIAQAVPSYSSSATEKWNVEAVAPASHS